MFKKGIFAVTALIFLFSSVSITFALDKGNKRKGKYTYRKVYKACMERGEVDSPKPPISPDTKDPGPMDANLRKKGFRRFRLPAGVGGPVGKRHHRYLHLSA
jgi:hypothetical protein